MRHKALSGPALPTAGEVDRINRVFSEAFTDRYQRDGLSGVRVPLLNPAIWRFAIATAGDGALVWRDGSGDVAAFNMVHCSGAEGWMGPLAVRPDCQRRGVGALMVKEGIRRLRDAGARVIGLETMPRTVDNIGFYSRLGFRPGHLTVSVTRDLSSSEAAPAAGSSAPDRNGLLHLCRELTESLAPGVDFTREIEMTLTQGLGDVTVIRDGARAEGFALWHSAPLAEGRPGDEARVLKLAATGPDAFVRLLRTVEMEALRAGARQLSIRCQTAYGEIYGLLLDHGYSVHWTDLRMTLGGTGDGRAAGGGVVFSNWEI